MMVYDIRLNILKDYNNKDIINEQLFIRIMLTVIYINLYINIISILYHKGIYELLII